MRHPLIRTLGPLALTLALALPAAAAGMSAFVPKAEYPGFSDVSETAWYAADVEKAVELGLMKGKGNGIFDPEGTLTVAEAVTMAVQVHAAYTGGNFAAGGDPWYENAVDYALENGLLLRGEYGDYTAPATRADMAGLFAYALPPEALPRINRVAGIPDVDAATPCASAIYLLYNAGVLAGTDSGMFRPEDTINRASAAAILNRLALPESRVDLEMDAPAAGNTVESPDGAFRLTVGAGEQLGAAAEGVCEFTYSDENGALGLLSQAKGEESAATLEDFAVSRLAARRDALGGLELLEQPDVVLFRGLPAVSYRYQAEETVYTVFCVENSGFYVELTLSHAAGTGADAAYARLLETAYTLDLAL